MTTRPRSWKDELAALDRVMREISRESDPETVGDIYWRGVGAYLPSDQYISLSRRGEQPPFYRITRSSRFSADINPWTHRHQLPLLSGGILGDIIYANAPVVIDDLPAVLRTDDPGYFYLKGFASLFACPQYDEGEGLNASISLIPPGIEYDRSIIPILHWQTGLFGRGTQNLVLRNQLTRVNAALDREMQVVGEIQRSLLPQQLPEVPNLNIAVRYETAARAGGDYYDFFRLSDGQLGMLIADVSGHGTPAAVLMAITHAIARLQAHTHASPSRFLEALNHHLASAYTSAGTFITAFYGVLDSRTGRCIYSCAGHNPPLLIAGAGTTALDSVGGLPLGILADQRYEEAQVQLYPGDQLVLYTDGIIEAMSPARDDGQRSQFRLEKLQAVLTGVRQQRAGDAIQCVWNALRDFVGAEPPTDDQTLILVRMLENTAV